MGNFDRLRKVLKSDIPVCLEQKFTPSVLPVLTYWTEKLTLADGSIKKIHVAQRSM